MKYLDPRHNELIAISKARKRIDQITTVAVLLFLASVMLLSFLVNTQ